MSRAVMSVCWGLLVGWAAQAAAPPPVEQWIVVCPPSFRETLEPLVRHRLAQGMRVAVVPPGEASGLRQRLHRLCRLHPGPSTILLVGDSIRVPTLVGTIGRMKGQPSDAGYGCLEDSRLPTVPVGRFPARTVDELRGMVAKTIAMETSPPGVWRRRLTVLAGIPDYNPVVDRLLESIAFARFDRLHPSWTGRAIYTASSSRFGLPAHHIRIQSLAYLREGQAFILYLGHSNAEGLYAGPRVPFLDRSDWGQLRIEQGGSVLITFGCNGCQLRGFDGEGYGLHAVRNPQGPVAVLGSHAVCYAAMVQLGADGLFARTLQDRPARRLGECWLAVLEGIARGKIDFLSYRMLDSVDGDPRTPQATQREEHLEMFVLLGDPALRLPQLAEDITLEVPERVRAGETLRVSGVLSERLSEATVRVSVDRSPSSVPLDLEAVPAEGIARDRVMQANHVRSNRFTVVEARTVSRQGRFTVDLKVPARVPGIRLIVRVHAATPTGEALTARWLAVEPMEEKKEP